MLSDIFAIAITREFGPFRDMRYDHKRRFSEGHMTDYLRYWSFREPPFGPAASRFYFLSCPQQSVHSWIQDNVRRGHRLGLITANSGCGMTTVFQQIARSSGFDDCATQVVLTSGRRSSVDRVYSDFASAMGVSAKRDSLSALSHAIDLQQRQSIRTVWLVDSLGKHSADAVVEASRKCRGLTIVASVTPRLHRVTAPILGKRIREIELPGFDLMDTTRFVDHSMQAAGCRKNPFTPRAIDALYRHTDGNVRRIVQLAHMALLQGASEATESILDRHIQMSADKIRRAA